MDRENRNSRQDSSNSRRQNRPNLQREDLENKDMSSRRRCPDCDGRIPKESGKPKSRVWKKVMWFTRRSRSVKNDICQCRSDEELRFNSNLEVEKHSNSWSFTRGASRKFRISSRKRKCKSDSFKKTCINPNVRQIEVCTVNESSSLSTRTDSVCSSGANSPTATGSFCDFGASTSQAGWRGSKRHKNTFVLTEIAREINPPLKNEDTFLSNIHPPLKKLSESSSSVSHISRRFTSPVLGNVRRSKSFPGSQGSLSPSKRRFMNTTNKTFASFSPPLKQKCYGLRRTATFSGKLNTELPKTCMKKSKSINNSDLMKLDKTSSLGEIRDQSGSIIGIVHFYKSPNKVAARRMSGINHELNKDRIFVEEESEHETVDHTSSKFISTRLPPNQTISESQKDVSFEPECTAFDKANKRADCEERFKAENIKSSCSCVLPEHILKPVVSIETLSKLSHIKEELSESALCDNTCNISVAVNANKPVEEMGVDISGDHKVKNTNQNDCVDTSDFEAQVTAVLNSQDCSEGTKHVVENISATNASSDIELSNPMTKEKATSGYAEEFKTKVSEPGLVKDGSSTTKATNISNLEFFSAKPDDHMSDGSHDSSDLLKEQPCTHSSKDVGHSLNCMSDNCHGCGDYHSNQQLAQPVSKLALETGSEIPVNGTMFPIDSTVYSDACLSSQSICVDTKTEHPGDHLRISTSKVKLNCSSVCTSVSSAPENLRKDTLCLKCMEEEKEVTLSQNHKSCLVVDGQFGGVLSEAEKNDEKSCRGVALNGFNGETSYIEPVSEETGLCQGIATDDLKLSGGTKHNSASKIGKADSDFAFEANNSGTNSVKPTNKGIDFYQENSTDSMKFSDEIKLRSNLARKPVLSSNDDTFEVFDSEAGCLKATSEEMELFRKIPNDRKLFNAEKLSQRFHTCDEIASDLDNGLEVFCSPTASSSMKPSGLYEDLSNETATGLRYSPQKSLSYEKSQLRRNSGAITSPGSLERSKTSDYASMLDESFSDHPEDVPIHTWKTSESDLKSEELALPVPGETFKMRTELMLSWFQEFNDEQRNIILKKILDRCELPQMHLLSVAMENNLHKTCPPNCQDMLVWLPYTVTLQILMYLDAVSLCRCNQVNRAWNELADNPLLWQRLTRNPDYQLCEASSRRQLTKFTHANGEIHWKKVFAERFLLQRNWLNGKYDLRTYEGHNQGIACVQFDDTRIVSGSYDKTIKLWDISNMPSELMLTLEGHSGTVRCLDLNGNRLVSGSTDRTIKVWDLSFASYWAGASCKVTMVGHLHTVRCLQADEKKLVSGSYDKTVKVWDLKTGVCQLTLRGHTAAVLCVQFDDQKIVSGSYDKKIKVWGLTEGTCLMTLDGHQDAVTCLNLTHDGMKIITGSLDYSLKFWDLSTGKCYGTLDWITSEGHTAVVRCLQVDSWRIISGGDDKTLKVWELATGQRLLTLRYHSDGVTCMQFNDFAIVSGSYDRTVKLWDFTPKHPYLEAIT